ncbi:integrase catalytic domain-containing protein [Trichonephila clavata]|uniref:Integrase catalytic domain-containing protein n=1 Tax=Trichonephila clavata TaxID=2740835 RepID=A0A8X6LTL4_TRICU|nr:integrase catalytic domain-containing protein [Trichonephila clavata]
MRWCVQFSLSSVWNKISALIASFESSSKYTSHPAVPSDIFRFAKSQKLILADPPEDSNLPIELLIGDIYWHLVTTKSPIKVVINQKQDCSIERYYSSFQKTYQTEDNRRVVTALKTYNINIAINMANAKKKKKNVLTIFRSDLHLMMS